MRALRQVPQRRQREPVQLVGQRRLHGRLQRALPLPAAAVGLPDSAATVAIAAAPTVAAAAVTFAAAPTVAATAVAVTPVDRRVLRRKGRGVVQQARAQGQAEVHEEQPPTQVR